jgi:transcriptional regulator with XRE-family HTH domain
VEELFDDRARRRELAEFLRARRERLTPAAAGLPSGRRRRTPGLRREEVAELAGLGTTWYTWLEQARDVKPSEGAIRQIARALQLDKANKRYLLELALERAPRVRRQEVVTPALQAMLNTIAGPAYVKGQRWDLLAYNDVANAFFDFDHLGDRNLLRFMFSPETRAMLPNWLHTARQHVAIFRAECAGLLHDPWILEIVDDLKARSPEFREWWSEQAVAEAQSGHKTYEHPLIGRVSFDFTVLQATDCPNLRLVVYVADNEETRKRLSVFLSARARQLVNERPVLVASSMGGPAPASPESG